MSVGIITGNVKTITMAYVTLTPSSVAANTTADTTVTIPGLLMNDLVDVFLPSTVAGIFVANTRVTANNTAVITFGNSSGAAAVPPSGQYVFLLFRAEGNTPRTTFAD